MHWGQDKFADNIFKCIFLNENVWIFIKIWLKFISKVRINNIPALVQIMAWRQPGDKPLSEPMMSLVADAYMRMNMNEAEWCIYTYMHHSASMS